MSVWLWLVVGGLLFTGAACVVYGLSQGWPGREKK